MEHTIFVLFMFYLFVIITIYIKKIKSKWLILIKFLVLLCVKQFENGKVFLSEGNDFVLTTKEMLGNQEKVSVTYKNLPKILTKDTKILLNDGKL